MTTAADIQAALDQEIPLFSDMIRPDVRVVALGDDGMTDHLSNSVVDMIGHVRKLGFTVLAVDTPHFDAYDDLNGNLPVDPTRLERRDDIRGWHGTELIRAAHLVGMEVVGVGEGVLRYLGGTDLQVYRTDIVAANLAKVATADQRVLYLGKRDRIVGRREPDGFVSATVPQLLEDQLGISVQAIVQAGGFLGNGELAEHAEFYGAIEQANAAERPFAIEHASGGRAVTLLHTPEIRIGGLKTLLQQGSVAAYLEQQALVTMFDIETAFDRVNETRSELLATLDISSGQWEQVLAVALLRDGYYWDAGTAFAGGGDVRSRARALLAIGDFDQAEDILVESVSPGELLFGYHRTLECLLHASRGSAEHRAHARRSAEALESFRHETHSPGDLSTTEEARRLISEAKRTPPSPLRQTRPSDRRSEGVEIAPIEQQPDGPSIPPPGLELPPPLP